MSRHPEDSQFLKKIILFSYVAYKLFSWADPIANFGWPFFQILDKILSYVNCLSVSVDVVIGMYIILYRNYSLIFMFVVQKFASTVVLIKSFILILLC